VLDEAATAAEAVPRDDANGGDVGAEAGEAAVAREADDCVQQGDDDGGGDEDEDGEYGDRMGSPDPARLHHFLATTLDDDDAAQCPSH